ncbi:MAG TPA: Gldg family protein [Gemmatimonadales bacterium]|nr:Gldg family protein [Gemmatimonadales bacterium]
MNRIWTIARRELKALFDHPTGYVLLVVFLAVNAFLFFRQAYFQGSASLRPMLDFLPWILLFFVPAVTMRALAEDTRSGQVEVLLAQPVTEFELLLGKYAGALLFLWIALALTLPIPLALSTAAQLPWGPIVAQYAGAALLLAGLAGVGVWASSLTRSQITAFITGVAVMFVLVLVGLDPLLVGLPPAIGTIAARLGVLSHFDNIGRGVVDLRDAVYFVSLAGIFLALGYAALLGRKLSAAGGAVRRLRLGTGLLVALLVVTNLLGSYIGGRLDLTPGHSYTLSPATRRLVGNLPDIVTITVFASKELPTEAALMKRDVDDLLHDLRSAGHGKIRVIERDPASDAAAKHDAQNLGVTPVQFNVVGQSELQVKQGYLGLVVQYAGGTETIPFIRQTNDLEYRLASSIHTLTQTKKPVLDLLADGMTPGMRLSDLQEQLSKSYDVRTITLGDTTQPAADVSLLVLLGSPDSLTPAQAERFQRFFDRGGNALVLASGMRLSPELPVAVPRPVAWNRFLKPFGITIAPNMAYDLLSNEIVPVPSDAGQVLQSYPLFIRARSTAKSEINREVGEVTLTWASTIDTTGAAKGQVTPLLVSSPGTGTLRDHVSVDPTQDFPQRNLAPRILAAVAGPAAGTTPARGRVVVVGSADFVNDRFVSRAPDNLALALNSVDWLAQDKTLIGIRSKDRRPPPLAFSSVTEREAAKYANVIGVPALVALYGLVRLIRRRRKTRRGYQPAGPVVAPQELPA